MKPFIAPPPSNPIDIDAGVEFEYVIPARGGTTFGYIPNENFEVVQDGKTLTIEYVGGPGGTFPLYIFASNADGTTHQKLNFRVTTSKVSVPTWLLVGTANGSSTIGFGKVGQNIVPPGGGGYAIGDNLAVDWKVKFSDNAYPFLGTAFAGGTYFIKTLLGGGQTFNVSLTSGGAAVADNGNSVYGMVIATAVNGSDKIYVGDTSKLAVDDAIRFRYSDDTPLPANLQGTLYVKSIENSAFIKVSATVGGAAIAAAADSFAPPAINTTAPPDASATPTLEIYDATRLHPGITSDPQTEVGIGAAVDYTITSELAGVDQFQAEGLPEGLELDPDTGEITGNPSKGGFFPVLLIAYKGTGVGYRYWLLIVGGTGEAIAPDVIYDIATRRFYAPDGPAGRADRIDVVQGDPPLLFGLQQNANDFTLPVGATVRIRAKQTVDAADDLVLASLDLVTARSQVQLDEDWSAAGLLALFPVNGSSVTLVFWFEWRLSTDPVGQYRKSYPTPLRVWRADAAGLADIGPSFLIQKKPFSALTGGGAAALDGVPTLNLAVDTWIARVIILNGDGSRTSSEWELVAGNEAEDVDAGIIRPDDYNGATNQKVWVRLD